MANDTSVDVDPVLMAFAAACPIPDASELERWCAEHPALAPALREYAEVARENFASSEVDAGPDPELDAIVERVLATGMGRIRPSRQTSLPELVAASGTTIPNLAKAVGIDRGVLADIVAGRLAPPIGPRLVAALSKALGTAQQVVMDAVAGSFAAPRAGFANSDPQTAVRPRTWEESIAASHMDDERKAHWLGGD